MFNISKFTEDEKLFLLNVVYNSKNTIPQTEYLKIIMIINGLNDYSIFNESSIGNNSTYRKFNSGIDYTSIKDKRKFITDIIEKLSFFKLKSITTALNLTKNKIQ